MPTLVVLDSTILVSAFLTPNGVADAVLQSGIEDRFTCYLSDDIVHETTRRLLSPRLQQRYRYHAADVETYRILLYSAFELVIDPPLLTGIVRDPNDDMIVACAVAASASHIVTRDDDLLSMETYEGIVMLPPEAFMTVLRGQA